MFRVLQIDHVELFVPDRDEAAEWYRRILGLHIIPEFEAWAAGAGGPLMISADGGSTKLALFEGDPQGSRSTAGFDRVAFRVDADGFIAFVRRLNDEPLRDDRDRLVTGDSVVDHDKSYSIYFCDPYGHRLEITTYDYDATAAALRGERAG
jgi:catechol 2,3-dioxygenase-like lactoylglutathione lyase family enzyme